MSEYIDYGYENNQAAHAFNYLYINTLRLFKI